MAAEKRLDIVACDLQYSDRCACPHTGGAQSVRIEQAHLSQKPTRLLDADDPLIGRAERLDDLELAAEHDIHRSACLALGNEERIGRDVELAERAREPCDLL